MNEFCTKQYSTQSVKKKVDSISKRIVKLLSELVKLLRKEEAEEMVKSN